MVSDLFLQLHLNALLNTRVESFRQRFFYFAAIDQLDMVDGFGKNRAHKAFLTSLLEFLAQLFCVVQTSFRVADDLTPVGVPRFRYVTKHTSPTRSKATEPGSGVVLSVPEPAVENVPAARLIVPPPVSVPLYQRNEPVPPVTFRTCVKGTVGGDDRSSCSWRVPTSVSPLANAIVNVPLFSPVVKLM